MSDNRKCPICCSEGKKVIKHIKIIVPEGFLLPSEYDMVTCQYCGSVFNDVPYSDAYDEYYSNYKSNTNFTIPSEDSYLTNKEKRENRHWKAANFIANNAQVDKDADILDVGCSYGATLSVLKKKGYTNLFGLDLDEKSVSFLRESGITSKRGSIFTEELNEFNDKFDLIILGHILEHLHEPKKAIKNISRWLKPNGKVLIECPDLYQYPKTSKFPGFFAEYEHINHFSIISLMNLMSDFNLKAYSSDTIYALIEDFPCLYTLFEKSDSNNSICKTMNDEICMKNCLLKPNKHGEVVLENIERLKDDEIALWGAGQFLYRILTHTPLNKCNIKHIVDRNPDKWGRFYFNIKIEEPRSLLDFKGKIVICTTTSVDSVLADINSLGIKNELIIPFTKESEK